MVKYTWDDVIVNPNDTRLKGAIGKYVYYAITPFECIRLANNNNIYSLDRLEYIQKECDGIFIVGKTSYPCIIIKKGEPKKYVPFESIQEFFDTYWELSKTYTLGSFESKLSVDGIWLKHIIDDEVHPMEQVAEIWGDGLVLGNNDDTTRWAELLEHYQFLDGTPCGKLKE